MEVSFYLRHSNIKEGSSEGLKSNKQKAIYARIHYAGNDVKFYPNLSINPIFWDKGKKRAKESKKFPQHPEFNGRLDSVAVEIKRIALRYANENGNKYPDWATLRGLLIAALRTDKKADKVTFLAFLADFIERSKTGTRLASKGKPIAPSTIKSYTTTKHCLEKYEQYYNRKVDFENMDMVFYNDFTKYLTLVLRQSANYIGKHIKIIKSVLNEATELGFNKNVSFKSRGFTAVNEETETVYLPEHELTEIAALDLSEIPRLDKVRDLFLIGCYTGLRFSDLSTLRSEHIKAGMITITAIKTGKPVVIPVHRTVRNIMKKYGGQLPKAISNQKTNEALKEITKKVKVLKKEVSISGTKAGVLVAKTIPKHDLVTTHTARRSFATNQFLAGIPTITIMAITGHKTEKAFMRYIKVAPTEHAVILQSAWKKIELKKRKG